MNPVFLDHEDYTCTFADACDAAWRAMNPALDAKWREHEGHGQWHHTSPDARRLATAVLAAAGVLPVPPAKPPPGDLPEDLHGLWAASYGVHQGDEAKFCDYASGLAQYVALHGGLAAESGA